MLIECYSVFPYLVLVGLKSGALVLYVKLIFSNDTIVEWQMHVHQDLVQIEHCSFLVEQDRLPKLSDLSHDYWLTPHDIHFSARHLSILHDLTCKAISV